MNKGYIPGICLVFVLLLWVVGLVVDKTNFYKQIQQAAFERGVNIDYLKTIFDKLDKLDREHEI